MRQISSIYQPSDLWHSRRLHLCWPGMWQLLQLHSTPPTWEPKKKVKQNYSIPFWYLALSNYLLSTYCKCGTCPRWAPTCPSRCRQPWRPRVTRSSPGTRSWPWSCAGRGPAPCSWSGCWPRPCWPRRSTYCRAVNRISRNFTKFTEGPVDDQLYGQVSHILYTQSV